MSIAQQQEIDELKRKLAALEHTIHLLCAAVGELQIMSDPSHPDHPSNHQSKKTLKLPEKRKSA
jgi:hypothetical protein